MNDELKNKRKKEETQMNKIAETVGIVYIYIYIVSFNLINHLYKHKAIIPYVFFVKKKIQAWR